MHVRIVLIVVLFGLFSFFQAFAYIPPSYFILQGVVKKRLGYSNIEFQSEITSPKFSNIKLKAITFVDFKKSKITLKISDGDQNEIADREIYFGASDQRLGSVVSQLLYSTETKTLAAKLIDLGVGIKLPEELSKIKSEEEKRAQEMSVLSRFEGRIGWVIQNGKLSASSLWIEKDGFVPLKLVVPKGKFQSSIFEGGEVVFGPFRFMRGFPYPSWIEIRDIKGTVQIHETITDLTTNVTKVASKKGTSKEITSENELVEFVLENLR